MKSITNYKEISFKELKKQYGLLDNPFVKQSPYIGKMFETYGKELDFVKKYIKEKRVLTLLNGEGSSIIISPGFWRMNRLGYLITQSPIEDNIIIIDK